MKQTSILNINYLIILISILILISCERNEKIIAIKGNIPNLLNGTMYLCKEQNLNKIDSVKTVNGKFEFNYNLESKEPIYLTFHHIDNNGVFSHISFKTKAKYKDGGFNSSVLLSDTLIIINDSLNDITPLGFDNGGKSKLQEISRFKAGYQTNAIMHTNGDLFDFINKTTYEKVLNKIKEYPNAYHLLFQINNTRNSFTATQVQNFLNTFDGEIRKSNTFKTLKGYNEKRLEKNKIKLPKLIDNTGKQADILDASYKKHLVVFWASWCGPCRQEIPALKEVYSRYNKDIEFVSISTDTNNSSWQKAVVKENMPWKQLIVNENSKEYEPIEICFQVSNSIPYVALIDNNMKVLKSTVGSMTEKELEDFLKD
ncbi:TlpA disulfide reductase family protein [Flavobacterium sp. j3]|uniref:TlpA disulfide reductase family protein n=1 Tax=Flavobacterium aureirubrum TaxID=3133147 RepID=A0ABU9N5U5_9FLAO